ncbi:hypothetical protein FO519_004663 [Halicephalobus sp. NKZ332]|nr:hypothetical protein FO519_004663 [Halicephalobus sp. NKZ332]
MEQRPTTAAGPSTPGCSLEEHYTNLCSLTELNGLNWMCLVPSNEVTPSTLDDCPVINTFNVCRSENILVHWKRRPASLQTYSEDNIYIGQSPAVNVGSPRELWIFWYNNKPDRIDGLIQNKLTVIDEGCWPTTVNGLEYNVRCMYFAAIHNQLELALTRRAILRFGRWFAELANEPVSGKLQLIPETMVARRFEFLVAGNCVNVVIQTQVQPTLLRVTRRVLAKNVSQPVILAPWGLRATLLPNQILFDPNPAPEPEEKSHDDSNSLNLSSFAGLYTTPEKDKSEPMSKKQIESVVDEHFETYKKYFGFIPELPGEERLPKMVQITVDGVVSLYPTALVAIVVDELVKDEIDEETSFKGEKENFETCQKEVDVVDDSSFSQNFIGLKASRKIFEEALLPPQERNEDRWIFSDWSQKGEFCIHCASVEDGAAFENLPSVASVNPPSGTMNPLTPHECQTKLSEPPSVPPTSIESVASVSGEIKKSRFRLRYKQPVYPIPPQYERKERDKDFREVPKSPRMENDIEEIRRTEPCTRTSWIVPSCCNEPVPCFADGEAPYQVDFFQLFPPMRENVNWDEAGAPSREFSPFTPINCVTPTSQISEDEAEHLSEQIRINCYEHDPSKRDRFSPNEFHLDKPRDKPLGLALVQPEDSPEENIFVQPSEETSLLKELLENDDDEDYGEPRTEDYGEEYEDENSHEGKIIPVSRRPQKRTWAGMDLFLKSKSRKITRYLPEGIDIGRLGLPPMETADTFDVGEIPDDQSILVVEDEKTKEQGMQDVEMTNYEAVIQKVPNPMISDGKSQCESEAMEVEPSTSESRNDGGMEMDLDKQPVKAIISLVRKSFPQSKEKQRAIEIFNKHNPFSSREKGVVRHKDRVEEVRRAALQKKKRFQEFLPELTKVYIEDLKKAMKDLAKPVNELLELLIEEIPGGAPSFSEVVAPKCFKGDVFYGNVVVPPALFDIIDQRNSRLDIADAPVYVKGQKSSETKAFKMNMAPYAAKENLYLTAPQRSRQDQQVPLQKQAIMQNAQRQGLGAPNFGQSPQMNGAFPQTTPSPLQNRMNTPGSFMMVGNTGAGGSVQMGGDSPMNSNFNNLGPQMTSTPNFGQSPPLNRNLMMNSLVSNGFPGSNLTDNAFNSLMFGVPDGKQALKKLQKTIGYIFASLLRDTTFDLHFDTVFDSCPLCSCHESIRTTEYGVYFSIPVDVKTIDTIQKRTENSMSSVFSNCFSGFFVKDPTNRCVCAFSAVRHRYLCDADTNLFSDDIKEATGAPAMIEKSRSGLKWFNPLKQGHWQMMDMIRWYAQGHDIAGHLKSEYDYGDIPDVGSMVSRRYKMSGIDQCELEFVVSTAIDAAMEDKSERVRNETVSLIHPWAIQEANEIKSPGDQQNNGVMMNMLQVLEDVAQVIRSAPATTTNLVEGPLTWKSLHRKATKIFKATAADVEDDTHEAEPIPNVLLGNDREMVMTLPTSLWTWERAGFAPYGWQKNVLYMAVVPDQSIAAEKCKIFLEDLGIAYEKLRFGRHLILPAQPSDPMGNGVAGDSLVRVPFSGSNIGNPENTKIPPKKVFLKRLDSYVKYYTEILKKFLQENNAIFERKVYHEAVYRDYYGEHHTSAVSSDGVSSQQQSQLPPVGVTSDVNMTDFSGFNQQHNNGLYVPPVINLAGDMNKIIDEHKAEVKIPQSEDPMAAVSISSSVEGMCTQDESNLNLPHMMVIYIVNPFTFGLSNARSKYAKTAFLSMIKSFNKILSGIEIYKRPRIQFEIIDLQTVFDYSAYCCNSIGDGIMPIVPGFDLPTSYDILRELAFTVYQQPRQASAECVRDIIAKTMTRFGPASQIHEILDSMQQEAAFFKIPTTPFVLAPSKSAHFEINQKGKLIVKNPEEKVLFITYCLVGDEFLIVSATDDKGELRDTHTLSISRPTSNPPNPTSRTNHVSLVGDAITRLWAYIQGLMSQDTKNWRLVIGRFGKIGHGEFKAWTGILTKKNLQAYNLMLKGKEKELMTPAPTSAGLQGHLNSLSGSCKPCALNQGYVETPALIAACLISTEAEPYLRIMLDALKNEKASRFPLNDHSVTHILVFPTSPCLMIDAGGDQGMAEDGMDDAFGDMMLMGGVDAGVNDDEIEGLDINFDLGTETSNIANQPVAVGYTISTAPAPHVPGWFWATCPPAKSQTPVHLKSALHISVAHIQQSDDFISGSVDTHALDSVASDVVLKFILQTYNELSWLNIDMITGQRRSCLPIHIQNLLQLYNGIHELSN